MSHRHVLRSALLAWALTFAGCDCGPPVAVETDSGTPEDDAGVLVPDAGGFDAGTVDAGATDAGEADAGEADAGAADAGEVDAGEPDAGETDGGQAELPDAGPLTCASCHGSLANSAPPRDTRGVTARTARTVGAHQAHLGSEAWRRTLLCEDCHRVPQTIEEPGHIDPSPAELLFGPVANASNVNSQFDGATCNTYCHGVSLRGGTKPIVDWMNDPVVVCGQCHGVPPPPPHPAVGLAQCAGCHLDIFTEPERHIDGVLDLALGCSACHGDATSPAPPNDTTGGSSTALRTVGAHRSHLGPSTWHAEVVCADCHTVPTRYDDPGHIDPSPAELTYGGTAVARGAVPTWNGTTCSNYCHGQTIDGGSNRTPNWTTVDGTQAACGTCHSLPPAGPHPANPNCSVCHGAVIAPDGGWVDPSLHINGQVEAQMACGSCHAVPPATGTHLLHVGTQGSRIYGSLSTAASVTSPTGYAFGCGNCHPTDPARHLSGGLADIELYNPNAPPGSLKARSPLAVYTRGTTLFTDNAGIQYTQGTCASVYCHSGPAYSTTSPVQRPGVDFSFAGYPVTYPSFAVDVSRSYQTVTWGGTVTGCGGCHGFPIRTTAAQASAGVGQSHSLIDTGGSENGHAWNHGGTPLPCRTCHFDTVTGLNTTSRTGGLSVYGPVPIIGFAQHVNGLPDVAFDKVDPVSVSGRVQNLTAASYSQTTSTCSNVACHKSQTAVKNGAPFRPDLSLECNVCHQY